MGIIDTIILILLLVFMIFGFFKGFLKQVFSTLAWIIALVAATLLSKPIGNILFETNIGIGINGSIYSWIANRGEIFSNPIPELTSEYLNTALSELGIPSFLHSSLINLIDVSAYQDISIAEIISPKIALLFLTTISFVVVYLIIFFTIKLLGVLSRKIVRGSALGFFDGMLGAVWGVVKVTIFVSIAMLLLSFITTLSFGKEINEWIINDMRLAEDGFGIAKYFYEYNPIMYVWDLIF